MVIKDIDKYFIDNIKDNISIDRYKEYKNIYDKKLKEYFILYDVLLYKIFCQRIEHENEFVIEMKFKDAFLSRSLIITRRVNNNHNGVTYGEYLNNLVKISSISDKDICIDYDFSFDAVKDHGAYDFIIQGISQIVQLIFLYKNVEHNDDGDYLNDLKDMICHYSFMYNKIDHKYSQDSRIGELSVGFNDLSGHGHTLIEDIKIFD